LFRVIDADDIHATIISCTSPQSKPQRVHLNQIKKFIGPEITTPALTAPEIPSEESEALKQSQAVELNEVIGYNHDHPENSNQNMNKSQDPQNPSGINLGTEIRNTHQYNLRSKRQ